MIYNTSITCVVYYWEETNININGGANFTAEKLNPAQNLSVVQEVSLLITSCLKLLTHLFKLDAFWENPYPPPQVCRSTSSEPPPPLALSMVSSWVTRVTGSESGDKSRPKWHYDTLTDARER